MKKLMLRCAQALCLAMMAVCLQSASCESEDEEDENGVPTYAKFVDITITHCERVGSVLQVDFNVRNKQNSEIEMAIRSVSATDNLGSKYDGVTSIGNNDYGSYTKSRQIAAKGSIEGHAKFKDFDTSNRARSIKLSMKVKIGDEKLSNDLYERDGIGVVDNRVMEHGIQTNDLNLKYTLNSCKRNSDGDLIIEFTLKNNSSTLLKSFSISAIDCNVSDDLGNNRYNVSTRWGTERGYQIIATVDIPAGSSVIGGLEIKKFAASAKEVNATVRVGCDSYIMNDEKVRFITIPVEN